ncbi:relaxase/mobilization nuclease domain-containing protein [Niabella aurantiaca]|uniref:relaxase/mobilization nuclease domain-containing protein n=1 Tax=Niabella aurantiaca TaxID=379900 RepID=UPI0003650480|nr:relaxase/mobilization nuclease domain-containing protein [Niabella aurantiaca]
MVAVIKASGSLRRALHYNENKLKENKAELIHANGFAKDMEKLGFTDKLRRFEKQIELNPKIKTNTLHISLNFDPSERLTKDRLCQIADTYMQKIGFGDQPYLVYQHNDAGHPHIHLVTTNVKNDGSYIKLHNIGRNQSEKARLEIEKEFKLVPAQREQLKRVLNIKPINAQKVQYGHSETKRAMTNVLDAVLEKYKYTSLPELNAVLKQYNMMADRGSKESRLYKNSGLVYRVLNEQGEKVGVPIKASDFYNKPTLQFLEQRFKKNKTLRQPHKLRIKNAIELAFVKKPGCSLSQLTAALQKERIQLVVRRNDKGVVYGMTYVDHQTKCVFNGSDIDKQYSAHQLLKRLGPEPIQKPKQQELKEGLTHSASQKENAVAEGKQQEQPIITALQEVLGPEREASLNPMLREELKKKRKKKLRH